MHLIFQTVANLPKQLFNDSETVEQKRMQKSRFAEEMKFLSGIANKTVE